jgi:DNA relaxase NicK
MGDWHRGTARTLALGSRASPFYLRIYEFKQKHGWGHDVRFELEVKVKPAHRLRIASMSLADIVGLHGLSADILREVGVDVQRAPLNQERRPPSSLEADLAWLSSQCWPAMCRVAAAHGGDVAAAWVAIAAHRDDTDRIRAMLTQRTERDISGEVSHTVTHE